ncbi:lipase LipD [Mycolicibacterium cyprinidarum]|uniref:Lipase LipD n=1 Tax=Mycolicibacterium cyprinidarum TaxID=2860311 RepID=A0ABQ4VD53_9MYCO|nr:lipase LipD [Mycolicibacterium sp. NGTWS0302]GJF19463.1 lipase LipD [Mycolicibacterium sp. NGTWSNA01]
MVLDRAAELLTESADPVTVDMSEPKIAIPARRTCLGSIVDAMAQSSVLTAESGLPSGVQGEADPHFGKAIRAFAALYPGRQLGGGALSVYIDGRPVVDVWMGCSDRRGEVPWTADTGAMVFSATKGLAATVIHRLADRGLIDYDAPVAEYWPEFGANGKSGITVNDVLRHRAGLAHLKGVGKDEVLDHLGMEARLAAAPLDPTYGTPAYHAVTYGWLLSGLARAVSGMGMRELFRDELARTLDTDGLHLGRPPAGCPTVAAQTLFPQTAMPTPIFDFVAPKIAGLSFSGMLGAVYFPGITSLLQGDMQFLDTEMPAANGVVTARALARMYGALANGGAMDQRQLLSSKLTHSLVGEVDLAPDINIGIPFSYHRGFQSSPIPGFLEGFGHIGLGGTIGWADPETGSSFGYVHNRLLTLMLFDMGSFAGLGPLLTNAIAAARRDGPLEVSNFGASFQERGEERPTDVAAVPS